VIASYQAAEAMKILTGKLGSGQPRAVLLRTCGDNTFRRIKIAPLLGKGRLPLLSAAGASSGWREPSVRRRPACVAGMPCRCSHRTASKLSFEDMARDLEQLGTVSYNRFLLRFTAEGFEFTVFRDGRAIIKGTSDEDRARSLYARYIGH